MHPCPLIHATSFSGRPAAHAASKHRPGPGATVAAARAAPVRPHSTAPRRARPVSRKPCRPGKSRRGRGAGRAGARQAQPRSGGARPARPGPTRARPVCHRRPFLPSAMTRLMRSFISPISTVCPTKSFWSRLVAPREPGPARKSRADWKSDISPAGTVRRGRGSGGRGGGETRERSTAGGAGWLLQATDHSDDGTPTQPSFAPACFRECCVIYDLTVPPPPSPPLRPPQTAGAPGGLPRPAGKEAPPLAAGRRGGVHLLPWQAAPRWGGEVRAGGGARALHVSAPRWGVGGAKGPRKTGRRREAQRRRRGATRERAGPCLGMRAGQGERTLFARQQGFFPHCDYLVVWR